MAVKKTDKDAVIDAALNLFRTQGYHHTSVADIAAACGLLKGSVYHYFAGKKELAMAALDRVIEESRDTIFRLANDPDETPATRLRNLAEAVERFFVGRDGGCLMGSLAMEVGDSIPEFRDRVRTYFDDWRSALVTVLEHKYGADRAAELAEDAIARAQGAILLMEVTKDRAVFHRAGRDTIALLNDTETDPSKDAQDQWKKAS